MTFKVPEECRVRSGALATASRFGNNGCFLLPPVVPGRPLRTIASDGGGWEHVSVTIMTTAGKKILVPTWAEMSYVRSRFWSPEDTVIQLHPPANVYVSNHDGCLHLWRPIGVTIPLPPAAMVGVVGQTHEETKALVEEHGILGAKILAAETLARLKASAS